MVVRLIEEGDDVASFRSGYEALDKYLVTRARSNRNVFGNTYVAIEDGKIVGYVTVMSKHVARESLGGPGPEEWPTLLIGRLAVRAADKSRGIGKALLLKVFEIAITQHYVGGGCVAVVVDAKLDIDPPADKYYAKFGFKSFKGEPVDGEKKIRRMYLRMKNVEVLVGAWKAAQASKSETA